MYREDFNTMTEEELETVRIHWNRAEKYAIIGYLFMSIDKKPDPDRIVRLDDLFGLSEDACTDEDETAIEEKREARDAITNECDKFLSSLDTSDRYDIVADVIDKFIDNEDSLNCVIGSSYRTFDGTGCSGKLSGAPYILWDLVCLVIEDADYNTGNKKRLLKHLMRKWDIEASVLPKLETAARAFTSIEKEREKLKASDAPYREVTEALTTLDEREAELWKHLKEIGISEYREVSEEAADFARMQNAHLAAQGLKPDFKVDLNKVEAAMEEGDCEEEEDDDEEESGGRDFWGELGDKVNMGLLNFFDDFATGIDRLVAKL
jgi:hypothetical protein